MIACCIGLILIVGIMTAAWYLPVYIEEHILPQLMEQAGINDVRCPVRRVGFFGADLGPLRIGKKGHQPITITAIQLDYSPLGLYRQRIRAVRLSGIELYGVFDKEGFRVHGLNPNFFKSVHRSKRPPEPDNQPFNLPIHIGRMALTHSTFHLKWNQKNLPIPFSVSTYSSQEEPTVFQSQLKAMLLGNNIQINGQVDLDKGQLSLEMSSAPLTADSIISFLGLDQWVSGNAIVRLNGKLKAGLLPPNIQTLKVETFFDHLNAGTDTIRLKSWPESESTKKQPVIQIVKTGTDAWQMNLKHLRVTTPANAALFLSIIKATVLETPDGALQINGHLFGTVPPVKDNGPGTVTWQKKIPVTTDFSGIRKNNGSWEIALTGSTVDSSTETMTLTTNGMDMVLQSPAVSIKASGDATAATSQVQMKIPTAMVSTADMTMEFQSIDILGDLAIPLTTLLYHPSFKLTVATSQSRGHIATGPKTKPISLVVPKLTLLVTGDISPARINGTLGLSGMKIDAPEYDTKMKNVKATIPFQWPQPKQGKTGNLTMGSTRLGTWNLGNTSIRMTQTDSGYTFIGTHNNPIFPKLKINVSGKAHIPLPDIDSGVHIRIDARRPASAGEFDLQPFIESAEGLTANGDIRAEGSVHISSGGTMGEVCFKLNDGYLTHPEQKTTITGLQTSLCLPALPDFRSAPQQKVAFETANLGNIRISNGTLDYQIESPKGVFIEKGAFQWSGGTVRLGAMRIQTDKEDYAIRLDCDRLNLAEILAQFGVAQGEGSGTVNGTIPVRFQDGRLFFDDGFLYSTPGVGGKIRLTGTENLTAGITEGTLQYHQIDLAREALKDFDYQWTKLGLNTEKGELVMRLQFDGKPTKPLPFEFRKDFGGFVRVDADGRGSHFQGISLDVNFRLPLDDLMQYKDILRYLE